MKKILLTLYFLLICSQAWATNYYIRVGGGTSTQCLGTTNVDYDGSGIGENCAFNHPAWAIGTGNTVSNGKIVGGDTVFIDDNGGTATYMIGSGMPNTTGCNLSTPFDWPCTLKPLPSGTAALPTRILGSAYNTGCSTKPQIWGTNMVGDYNKGMFNASGSNNIDIECLEITDHSTCGFRTGGNFCNEPTNGSAPGTYARGPGIFANGGSNFILKNLDIHGLAGSGMRVVAINGMTLDHVNLDGNHEAGWNGAYLNNSSDALSGNIIVNRVKTRFSGCSETYPRSGSFTASDYSDCTGDPASGAYSDGWGFANTSGNWIITDSEWSHNMSDGLDLLYGQNGMNVSIDRSLFEGNNGNQLKVTAKNFFLTNSVLIGNCNYLSLAGKVNGGDICRAGGVTLSLTPVLGSVFKITNTHIYAATDSDGSAVFEIVNRNGSCNGTETYTFKNDIFWSKTNSGGQWVPYYSGLSGSCQTAFAAATTDHSVVYNFQTNPSGMGNVFTAPPLVGSISQSSYSNVANVYPSSNVGGAISTSYWNTSNDYNNFAQNASIDKGAIQFNSVATAQQAGQACVATSDCASGTCSNFVCSGGGCTALGGACSGNTCCGSNVCTASVCSVPSTCGDAVIQSPEVCDTSNLNGQNCILQGFTGGSLTCASNCLSFVTSSCTNTLVFPLTPILDTFTRANSTGISNTKWTSIAGSFNISSNSAIPVTGGNGTNSYYWNAASFAADEEAYVTISNKGSNGDCVKLTARYNPAANSGYSLEYCPTNTLYIFKEPGEVQLGASISQTISSGDSIGFSIVGSTITAYYKASAGSWTSLTTRSDSTYTVGGAIRLGSYTGSSTPDIKFTNFGGGSLNPITCGNSLREANEVCDGTDLAGQTCVTKGFASGTLSCSTDCQSFVTSSCVTAAVCGDNNKDVGEICDGTALDSQTCTGLGFASGSLSCASDCMSYITTGCVTSNPLISGGMIFK